MRGRLVAFGQLVAEVPTLLTVSSGPILPEQDEPEVGRNIAAVSFGG